MSRFAMFAVCVTASLAIPAAARAASFDCNGDITYTEKTICDNRELSRMDDRMSRLYFQVVNNGNYSRGQAAQVRWLHERDACGANVDCLWGEYNSRIEQLRTGRAY